MKIIVDAKRLLELISPEEYFGLFGLAGASMSSPDIYALLVNFVADNDGNIMTPEEARKYIKTNVKMSDFAAMVGDFRAAIISALANPTKGGG